jgi:hypothetical protein
LRTSSAAPALLPDPEHPERAETDSRNNADLRTVIFRLPGSIYLRRRSPSSQAECARRTTKGNALKQVDPFIGNLPNAPIVVAGFAIGAATSWLGWNAGKPEQAVRPAVAVAV